MYPRPVLKKATMVLIDSSSPDVKLSDMTLSKKKIKFQFNPKELSLSRSVSVNPGDREPDSYYSPIKVDGKSTYDELSFELTLDQSASSMAVTAGTFFLPVTKAEVPLTLMPNTFLPSLPNVTAGAIAVGKAAINTGTINVVDEIGSFAVLLN